MPVSRWSPYCLGWCGGLGYILVPVTAVPVVVMVTPSIASGGAYGPTRCVLVDYMSKRSTDRLIRVLGIRVARVGWSKD